MRSISHLPRSLLPHSHLPTHPSFPRLALHSRFASTSTSTPPPTSTSTPPRPRIEATTFDGKSSPREVHERPERIRGMPPKGLGPAWQKAGAAAATTARPSGQKGEEEDFAGPSRPRMYYDRPGERDLPKLNSRAPLYILVGAIGLSIGGAFILYATNAERLASSVLRQVQFQLRNSKEVMDLLGENVKMAPEWWTFGQPWTSGTINMMQGRVDLKFRIQGSRGAGTVYFTSIRPQQEGAWRIVRYKLIADSGEVLHLNETAPA